jgi:CYTH domain-containing protein
MGLEIERKFLLKNSEWKKIAGLGQTIKQGYLNLDAERTVRVRIVNEKGILTIKGKTVGMTRLEFEYEIPIDEAEEIIKLSDKTIIEKTRYEILIDGLNWEIDIFEGNNKGLEVAEIELDNENTQIVKPEWIGLEVTEDTRYYNSNLIINPYEQWKDNCA